MASKHNVFVVEDAAHCINAFYKVKPFGSFGHLATILFHETKNITCGEGGLLIINDDKLIERAKVIKDKGTNRSQFLRGDVANYSCIDVGSSFAPSELNAAYLFSIRKH
jgi:dTDP-4-amino-4,6-dideoxygalactose transaminase